MKSEFSSAWKASTQPRKQRKYRHNAPLHTKHKFLSAHLSKDLQKKHGKRSLPLRVGDEVLVMRGSFRKKKGKVTSVNHKTLRVQVADIQRSKKDGSKVNIPLRANVLQLIALNTDDKERLASSTLNKVSVKKEPIGEKNNASDKKSNNN